MKFLKVIIFIRNQMKIIIRNNDFWWFVIWTILNVSFKRSKLQDWRKLKNNEDLLIKGPFSSNSRNSM